MIRLKVFKRLWVDDGFLLAGWLCALAMTIIWQIEGKDMYFAAAQRIDVLPPPIILHRLRGVRDAFYTSLWLLQFIQHQTFFSLFLSKTPGNCTETKNRMVDCPRVHGFVLRC